MRRHAGSRHAASGETASGTVRFYFLFFIFLLAGLAIVLRLGYLQIMQYGLYSLYASDRHELAANILPTRGQVLVKDRADGALHPLATNRLAYKVFAVPKEMPDRIHVARALAMTLNLSEAELTAQLTRRLDDPYELIAKDVPSDKIEALRAQHLPGINFLKTAARFYPEVGLGGQLIGFVAEDKSGGLRGQYGIEGAFDAVLAGTPGRLVAEKDASGRRLTFGSTKLQPAVNGADIILTLDRTIQFKACELIQRAVHKHSADAGSLIVMEPNTGAILALCSAPDFNPTEYNKVKELKILNNPVTLDAYEPGSVFKPFTLAAGLDTDKITPKTTYVDTGAEKLDKFVIRNSDGKAHGVQNMTTVLAESLNTGTIFVQRLLGRDIFRRYVEGFGFGQKTKLELSPEAKGNVMSLAQKGDIFGATASFGQGVTVTPLQLIRAYAALGNGGRLMQPYLIDVIHHPDGSRVQTEPRFVAQPISARTSRLISGMLVAVVEQGHGKRAGVPGYWVAGKTGTAQVPRTDGPGYQTDVTIGSFVGYAPASDPKFVMLVKIDHPRDVQWAESSAAPLFGEMAKFLLTYFRVPPERPVVDRTVSKPSSSTSSTRLQAASSTHSKL